MFLLQTRHWRYLVRLWLSAHDDVEKNYVPHGVGAAVV